MESRYYETLRTINKLVRGGLGPTFTDQELAGIKPTLAELDKSISSTFKGVPCGDGKSAYRLADKLLSIVVERPLTDRSKEYITCMCMVISLWNMNCAKDDNLENLIVAITQLINQATSIQSLLAVVRSWLPTIRSLANQPLAFGVARHYLEALKDERD